MFSKRQNPDSSAFEKEWEDRTREQMDEHDRQSKHADEQSRRFDKLLGKWEEQARRQDAILDAMEKQYGIRE